MEAYQLTVREAGNLLKRREISAKDLTQSVLDRIESIEPLVRSFITINKPVALRYAEKADELIQRGETTRLLEFQCK